MNATTLPILHEMSFPGDRVWSIDWSPKGDLLVVGMEHKSAVVLDMKGTSRWSKRGLRNGFVRWSPCGRYVGVSGSKERVILDAANGDQLWSKETNGGKRVEFSSDGRRVCFTKEQSEELALEETSSGEVLSDWSAPSKASWAVTRSPDGQTMAIGRHARHGRDLRFGSKGSRLDLLDLKTHEIRPLRANSERYFYSIQWSPEGRRLACATGDSLSTPRCFILDVHQPGAETPLPFSGPGVWSLTWSRRGDLIAIGSRTRGISEILDSSNGEVISQCSLPTSSGVNPSSVAFSPDGLRLAVGCSTKIQILDVTPISKFSLPPEVPWQLSEYSIRQVATLVAESSGNSSSDGNPRYWVAPSDPDTFLDQATALHRLDLTPPLSLLRQLDRLLVGSIREPATEDLVEHPGIRRLRRLRWPSSARTGLIALLLRDLSLDPWRPPPGTDARSLRISLEEALGNEAIEHRPEPFPGVLIQRAAQAIDERLALLLDGVGPATVRENPGLPLRLLAKVSALPPSTILRRSLLDSERSPRRDGSQRSSHLGGGIDGIQRRGQPSALLPSQLALPPNVLAMRHLRGDLLYRSHASGEPLRLRPTVIVLDVSPPTFGAVEKILRPAAFLVAQTLLEAGRPALLVTLGGRSRFHVLDRRPQLLACWTSRSLEPARPSEALRAAEALRQTLRGGPVEPIVLLLSHLWSATEIPPKPHPSVRALLVRTSEGPPTTSFAGSVAGRLQVVDHNAVQDVSSQLLELLR